MKVISNSARVLVAAAFLLVGVIGFTGSAGAVSTGSVVNNGAGGVTVTYTAGQGDAITVMVYSSGTICSPGFPGPPLYFIGTGFINPPVLGASPFTLNGTTTVNQVSAPATTIPTGLYQFCLYSEYASSFTLLSSVQTTIGTVTPTTTSSTTSTTTPAADPATDPVAPAFTG